MYMNEKLQEIKLCPFCEGVSIVSTGLFDSIRKDFVECEECESTSGMFDTEEEAIEAWNKRTVNI